MITWLCRATLSFVHGSVAVAGYWPSSAHNGSPLWYCTLSSEHCSVQSASSKRCHLAVVVFPRPPSFESTPPFCTPRSCPLAKLQPTLFYVALPAMPSSGSLFPSDRLASSAVAMCAVAGVGCRSFRLAASSPHRACTSTSCCSDGPIASSSFLAYLKVVRLQLSRWGY